MLRSSRLSRAPWVSSITVTIDTARPSAPSIRSAAASLPRSAQMSTPVSKIIETAFTHVAHLIGGVRVEVFPETECGVVFSAGGGVAGVIDGVHHRRGFAAVQDRDPLVSL